MKRLGFLMMAVLFVFAWGCAGIQQSWIKKGDVYRTEGWLDNNTYQVHGVGIPPENIANKIQRRALAKEAALMDAQKQVIESMHGYMLKGKSAADMNQIKSNTVYKEVGAMAKGGRIVQVTFGQDNDECDLVYQVSQKGLKKKMSFSATDLPETE